MGPMRLGSVVYRAAIQSRPKSSTAAKKAPVIRLASRPVEAYFLASRKSAAPTYAPTKMVSAREKLKGIMYSILQKLIAAWLAATAMVPKRATNKHSTPKILVSRKIPTPMGSPTRRCSRKWAKEKPEGSKIR